MGVIGAEGQSELVVELAMRRAQPALSDRSMRVQRALAKFASLFDEAGGGVRDMIGMRNAAKHAPAARISTLHRRRAAKPW
jgi:hypothetical protein